MKNPLRRWALGSNVNLRDLGGYACAGGGITRYGQVLRSDRLQDLSCEDKEYLLKLGLTDVMDLRSEREQQNYPNSFLNNSRVTVHGFQPVTDLPDPLDFSRELNCLGEGYIEKVDNLGPYYVRIIEIIANAQGITIFHCMAGKDRTGIVSALLLLLLGVDELDVVADYQTSETFLRERHKKLIVDFPDIPLFWLSSDANNMYMLIEHLNEKYGGAGKYLRSHGLSGMHEAKLREKLVALD